jgi:uncharacterized protein (DUF1810 family)
VAENGGKNGFNLERFLEAQAGVYEQACAELRAGRKRSHWMWFVFPQIAGLGQSQMSRTYAISSLEEARAYLEHPVLGPRLIECTGAVASAPAPTAEQIFGGIDTQKLHSSMTLFLRAEPKERLFKQVLDRYFAGIVDSATDQRLQARTGRARTES